VPIAVEPFGQEHVPAVREFNRRTQAGGVPFRFPESAVPHWLPRLDSSALYQEHYVALESKTVRGGYILKRQAFACKGEEMVIGNYQLPISEGAIDTTYALVGFLMLKDALKREPLLFALGIGGYQEALTQMLKAMKWSMVSCPFFFKVIHPFHFLRGIAFLRQKVLKRLILDYLAFSGLGWIAIRSLQLARTLTHRARPELMIEEVERFTSWCDDIWTRMKTNYALVAVRDAAILNTLYPEGDHRFRRLKVLRRGNTIGWAVVLNTKMEKHKYFGHMRVGSVVDCLAVQGEESAVVAMATWFLERLGADIIVTNQLHHSWCNAFGKNGYFTGPSNFIFAASPQLAHKLHPFEGNASRVHLTRGDGDGPIHL
jgi:hypothetical protein